MRNEQFLRISRLLGDSAIKTLHDKTVTVVGLGAVGGMALSRSSAAGRQGAHRDDTIGIITSTGDSCDLRYDRERRLGGERADRRSIRPARLKYFLFS